MTTTIPAGWLPIESAPKDSFIFDGLHHYGTKIIVFDGSINTARWWRIEGDSASNFIDEGGRAIYPTHWMPLPAAPGVSTVEDPGFPAGAIVNGRALADRLEAYPFESQGGDLRLCSDWVEFRRCFEYLAEWVGSRAPAAGDAQDAARWRFVRRKLCLTGNGDGTCAMQAINLPASIPGWPEPGSAVAEFCDAAIDAAIAAQRKGDAA